MSCIFNIFKKKEEITHQDLADFEHAKKLLEQDKKQKADDDRRRLLQSDLKVILEDLYGECPYRSDTRYSGFLGEGFTTLKDRIRHAVEQSLKKGKK